MSLPLETFDSPSTMAGFFFRLELASALQARATAGPVPMPTPSCTSTFIRLSSGEPEPVLARLSWPQDTALFVKNFVPPPSCCGHPSRVFSPVSNPSDRI